MKKLFSLLLSIFMVLSTCAALAEDTEKTVIPYDDMLEFAMLFPDGYEIESEIIDDFLIVKIENPDSSKPLFLMTVAPDEEYSELERLNDLTEADFEAYVQSLLQDYACPSAKTLETSYGSKVVLINDDNTESDSAALIGIYKGYALALYIEYPDGSDVDEEAVNTAVKLFSDMDFVYTETEE